MGKVRHWLEAIGLAQYADGFESNDIDLDLLGQVVAEGHRRIERRPSSPHPQRDCKAKPGKPACEERERGGRSKRDASSLCRAPPNYGDVLSRPAAPAPSAASAWTD